MGALLSVFARWLLSDNILRFIAFKVVLYTLVVVIVPIILWNLGVEWLKTILDFALKFLPQGDFVAVFGGLAGWFIDVLKLQQVVDILVSALIARFIISAILSLR